MTVWLHLAVHAAKALKAAADKRKQAEISSRQAWTPPRATVPLVLDLRCERIDGGRELRLRVGGGEAWLVLCDPDPHPRYSVTMNEGVLDVRDREEGTALLRSIGSWLWTVPPPARVPAGPLRPFAFRWSKGAAVGGAERLTLRFAWAGRTADVYLDLPPGAVTARLVEKDTLSRATLVSILAVALRDGAPD